MSMQMPVHNPPPQMAGGLQRHPSMNQNYGMPPPQQHLMYQQQSQRIPQQQHPSQMDPLEYAMELSKKDMERNAERPGMVKVPGTGSRNTGPSIPANMNRDVTGISPDSIQMLVSMGFTQDQAIFALREKNNDVAAAADMLLGGM